MLIRLISDGTKNPSHYDKLIAIDGLPDEWIFDRRKCTDDKGVEEERIFLRDPWETDITENIPEGIRLKFQPASIEVWFETPAEIRPGTYAPSAHMDWIRWIKNAYGFRLNVQTNQGKAMWDQILDLLDRETPRSQRIPEPAVVGDKMQWLLEPSKVPHVKLTGTIAQVPKEQVAVIAPKVEPRPDQYACPTCGDIFDKQRGRWMHERKKHGNKAPFLLEREKAVA